MVACLLLLAGYVFWETLGAILGLEQVWHNLIEARESGSSDFALFLLVLFAICCLPIAVYWTMQYFGMTRLSFWTMTLAALIPQLPAVLSFNQLDWPSFWTGAWSATGLSQFTVAGLFLASLFLLISLHRVGEIRRLKARLSGLRLDVPDQERVIANELLVLGGLIGSALVLTLLLLSLGVGIAQMQALLMLTPWTVLTVGVAAILLLAAVFSVWVRRSDAG